jgi:hypothetical protein
MTYKCEKCGATSEEKRECCGEEMVEEKEESKEEGSE